MLGPHPSRTRLATAAAYHQSRRRRKRRRGPGFTLHKLDTARHCAAVLSALPQGNIRSMKVAVVKERRAFEHRVAASPDTIKRMIGMGLQVVVESGAGEGAWFSDPAFAEAGASIAADEATALDDADIVLKVQRPLIGGEGGVDELALLKRGAVLIGLLQPAQNP